MSSELKKLAADTDAGRVRSRLIEDLQIQARMIKSELQEYPECFTESERRRLKALRRTMKNLRSSLNRTEDRRVAYASA